MKVVITHTDLRIYWPSRIAALQRALESRGDALYTVEIAGAGSPYAFAGNKAAGQVRNWTCLFPDARMEGISPRKAARKLRSKLYELNPDVVLSGSIAFPSGATAVYWAKANHKAVVIFDDIRPGDVPRGVFVNYIKRLLYGQVDAVLCPSPSWTDAFRHWNFRDEQLFFGVDVVDNAFWSRAILEAPPPEGMKEWLSPYFLAVGRLIPAKNFLFLLSVYAQYRALVPDPLSLVVIGDGPERGAIKKFIRDRGLEAVYLLPFADPSTLRSCYHHAAALVLPSRTETWGLVVNEAMAAGLPVLVSDACGCASELVREGINGYIFSPQRPDRLLAALLSFTQKDAAAKAAMGKASQQVIQSWGLDQFVEGSLGAIDYAVANRKICRSMQARLVLRHWKGRYRPV